MDRQTVVTGNECREPRYNPVIAGFSIMVEKGQICTTEVSKFKGETFESSHIDSIPTGS